MLLPYTPSLRMPYVWGHYHLETHELQKHVQNITPRQLLETAIRNIWTEIPIYYIQDAYASEASN
jgi:hypothetical protein